MLVHRRPLVYWNDALRRRRAVSQCAVRPDRVVMNPPFFDQDLGLAQAIEQFTIEELLTGRFVNALSEDDFIF